MQKAPHANCDACPLKYKPAVFGEKKRDALATIVGESPGYEEVKQGHAFVGPSGRLLWAVLDGCGLSRDQFNVTNTILCQPSFDAEEKKGTLEAAAMCCRPRLIKELEDVQTPILLLGTTARHAMFPVREDEEYNTTLNRWDKDVYGRDVIATLHPAYVLREPDDASLMFEGIEKFAKRDKHTPVVASTVMVYSQTFLEEVLLKAKTSTRIVYDLETDQIDREYNKVLMMVLTFAEEPTTSYVIPARHPGASCDLLKGNTELFNSTLWASPATKVAHNGKFDAVFLRLQYGHNAYTDFDTMIAHYVLDENSGHGLKELGARFLDTPDWERGIVKYREKKSSYYSKIPWSVLIEYAGMDTVATLELSYMFEQMLREEGLYEYFKTFKMAESDLFTRVECTGFKLDIEFLRESEKNLDLELSALEKEITEISGGAIQNARSSQQVSHYVYDVLKIPQPKGRKIKPRSVNKDVIELLKDVHPVIPVLKKHRKVQKVQSTYVRNILEEANEDDELRLDVRIIGAETQRSSASLFLTMPRVGDKKNPLSAYTSIIRGSFVPHPGMLLWQDDYSQAELRIAADLSGDPFLLQVFRDGRDLHSEVAIAMYGQDFTKEQRMLTKMFNFSYLYGGNEHSFAEDAGLPISVAIDFVHRYNEVMPGLKRWKDAQEAYMMEKGFVRYRTGACRRYPLILDSNRDDARKAAYNSPVQGPAYNMCALSAFKALPMVEEMGGHILLLVHDSIIGEAPVEVVKQVALNVRDIMEQTASEWFPSVTWVADPEVGERWSTLSKLNS